MDGRIRKPGPDPGVLLRVSEHFLVRRHYEDCRKYAHQAHQINPNFPGVTEILAVADVLLAAKPRTSTGTLPDWYAIMQVDRYSQDAYQIRQKFYYLYGILSPSNNKFPFADEAFDTLRNAWFVLSNPVKKLEYDDLLKKLLNDDEILNGNCDDSAFWTVCPYCYYVYEYPRVYLECCLRCPNEKCSRAFTCVEIDRPSVEVIKDGKYMCTGFLPVGFQNGNWNPYVPLSEEQVNVNGSDDAGKFVEISDDDDDSGGDDGESDKSANVCLKSEVGTVAMKQNAGRKKSVAKKTKKVTGAGIQVKEGFLGMVEMDMIVRSTDNEDDGCENGFNCGDIGGVMDQMDFGGVEFYDADDDLLVSLQNDS